MASTGSETIGCPEPRPVRDGDVFEAGYRRAVARAPAMGQIGRMGIETLYRQQAPQTTAQAFSELSVVAVLREVRTDEGAAVPAGTEGTIVAVYPGGLAYEVEFIEPAGIATVRADGLRAA